jgi:UDP-2-acetamido-3-amino-2,3-dideoxy-glucuronate N-acetyltransferase
MPYIHPSSDIQTARIGEGTRIWQYVVILQDAVIGEECNICSHCLIENDVVIGDRVTIKSGVQLWDGVRLQDDVFVGPNVSFTNDRTPRSKAYQKDILETVVEEGASLGAGATILPGLRLGRNSMIGAGAVVTRSVPPNAIVVGNPARIIGYATDNKDIEPRASAEIRPEDKVSESRVKGVRCLRLSNTTDIRGSLTAGEFGREIPFDVKRYFMVFDVPSVETRGEHAHKTCHQFLVCAAGQVKVMVDDGVAREEFLLDRPSVGLHIPPGIWGAQYHYSPDAVLVVMASEFYDPDDYIRDYNEFIESSRANG